MTAALLPCKTCGKSVSPLAKACPHCGAPDPTIPVAITAAKSVGAILTGCVTIPILLAALVLMLGKC